ncbi:MAG TPA: phosphate ABC transporter substrate-binding protein PstS [Gemmatimonadaceae bacterium]|nr:phosphate ABC transporter substrate-binding protein PstS [Gemmatimonadaceae bacterium]
MNLRSVITLAAGLGLVLTACGGGETNAAASDSTRAGDASATLTGAGSTFIYPILSRWTSDYAERTGVRVNYASLGSGAGIRQLSERTVDFGATDAPMTAEEMAAAKGGAVLHVPMVLGADVVIYNLPAVAQPLQLTGDVIADIFLGRITKWNDARVAATNPGVALPAEDIIVVHRTDGSGTTYIFTDYLASVSPQWANGPGRGKQVNWPVGLGAKGNEGVSAQVKQTPGAIGYTELAYATQNGLPVAAVRNQAGNFVAPTTETIQNAAAGALSDPSDSTDFRISIVNPPGPQAYPIASMTWILLYRNQTDATKARQLLDFLRWTLTEGGDEAAALDYAPLPEPVVQRVLQRLDSVQVAGVR